MEFDTGLLSVQPVQDSDDEGEDQAEGEEPCGEEGEGGEGREVVENRELVGGDRPLTDFRYERVLNGAVDVPGWPIEDKLLGRADQQALGGGVVLRFLDREEEKRDMGPHIGFVVWEGREVEKELWLVLYGLDGLLGEREGGGENESGEAGKGDSCGSRKEVGPSGKGDRREGCLGRNTLLGDEAEPLSPLGEERRQP